VLYRCAAHYSFFEAQRYLGTLLLRTWTARYCSRQA
jgi:hypothetical protein